MRFVAATFVGVVAAITMVGGPTTAHSEWNLPQIAQLGAGGAPCVISAAALKPVPEGVAYRARGYSDTDLDIEIRESLEAELERTNHSIADAGPLQLDFDNEIMSAERAQAQGPSLGRFRVGGDEPTRRGVDVQVNVWSSSQDSLLGGRQQRGSGQAGPSVFRLNVVLRDTRIGTVLWEAHASCEMLTTDTGRIARSMVPQLVDKIGHTVRNEPFDLQ